MVGWPSAKAGLDTLEKIISFALVRNITRIPLGFFKVRFGYFGEDKYLSPLSGT
jgi:hypothetical protein